MVNEARGEGYVRNTEAGHIPETSRWGELWRRMRADSAILGMKRGWVIGIGSALAAGVSFVGYRLWKKRNLA